VSTEQLGPSVGWRARLKALGKVGLLLHFTLYGLTIAGFFFALHHPTVREHPWIVEHIGEGGLFVSAWVLSRLTIIPRVALTCAVTPLVAPRINALFAGLSGRSLG
jgi:hypothetical protein